MTIPVFTPPSSEISAVTHSLIFKIFFIGFLLFFMMIPLLMIYGLVGERQYRQQEAIGEVSEVWGRPQVLYAPVFIVPYDVLVKNEEGKTYTQTYAAYLLPDALKVESEVFPEVRARGIFEVTLYRVKLRFSGQFPRPDANLWRLASQAIRWNEAVFSVGISDTRGIQDTLTLQWDGKDIEFLAGTGAYGISEQGLHAPLAELAADKGSYTFDFTLDLTGNEYLQFIPVGKKNTVNMRSTWADPSFMGAFLPSQRQISEQGFSAQWDVSHLGRSSPQMWTSGVSGQTFNLERSAFGVRLLKPVDFYLKSERSVKYGILFLILTFMTFFLFEIFNPIRIHFMQYLMVGAALCLFYLLLLSLSEQVGFVWAYLVASFATISLITGYSASVLRSYKRAGIMGGILVGLYVYLYILLNLQDYSLLFGAIGLFVMLATVMMITRHIDWYALNLQPINSNQPSHVTTAHVVSSSSEVS